MITLSSWSSITSSFKKNKKTYRLKIVITRLFVQYLHTKNDTKASKFILLLGAFWPCVILVDTDLLNQELSRPLSTSSLCYGQSVTFIILTLNYCSCLMQNAEVQRWLKILIILLWKIMALFIGTHFVHVYTEMGWPSDQEKKKQLWINILNSITV